MCNTIHVFAQDHDVLSKNKRKRRGDVFCSKVNSKIPSQKVWKDTCKMKGKRGSSSIGHFRENGNLLTDKNQIANLLASNISQNFSTENDSPYFQKITTVKEKKCLNFSSDNQEDYTLPISLPELKHYLEESNDSATGLDEVHYQLLTHLPDTSLTIRPSKRV